MTINEFEQWFEERLAHFNKNTHNRGREFLLRDHYRAVTRSYIEQIEPAEDRAFYTLKYWEFIQE